MTVTMQALFVLVTLCCLGTTFAAKLPASYKRCSRTSTKFNECLKDAIQSAIRELKQGAEDLGVFPMDPLDITKLDIGQGGDGPVSLSIKFSNIDLYGISDSTVKSVHTDLKKNALSAEAFTPILRFEGDYAMNGKVLLLPINGKGKCNITLYDMDSNLNQLGEPITKDGKVYIKQKQFEFIMAPKKLHVQFDNLFNDKALSDQMNIFLNENWQDIFKELKPSLEDGLGQIFLQISNRFYSKVPMDDIFLP